MSAKPSEDLAKDLREALDRAIAIAQAMHAKDGATVMLMSPRTGNGYLNSFHEGVSINISRVQTL